MSNLAHLVGIAGFAGVDLEQKEMRFKGALSGVSLTERKPTTSKCLNSHIHLTEPNADDGDRPHGLRTASSH